METLTAALSPEAAQRHTGSIVRAHLAVLTVAYSLAAAPVDAVQPTAQAIAQARDYVFAACVMLRYPDTPLAAEADAWAAGLIENGDLPADDYKTLSAMVAAAPTPPATRSGIVLRLQSCLTLANDAGTARRIRQLLHKSAERFR